MRPEPRSAASGGSAWRRVLGWAIGILTLAALFVVVARMGDIERFLRLARQAEPLWLVPACAAQVATYVLAAAVWWCVLRSAGTPRRLIGLIPLGIGKLFTDQAIPSGGFSGSVFVTIALDLRGIPPGTAIGALLVGLVSFNTAYLASVLGSIGVLWARRELNPALLAVVAVFAVVAVAIPLFVLGVKRWSALAGLRWLRRFRSVASILEAFAQAPTHLLRHPRLIAATAALQLGVFVLDASTLWFAFRAIGIEADFSIAFVGFVLASVAATIGPIPLGLGTFEAACVVTLGVMDVPLEAALTATLLLRGLSFWLPMLPGLWLARREVARAIDLANPQAG